MRNKKREIDKKAVGSEISRRRKALDLTVEQLAEETKLDTAWLIQLERGEIDLPVDASVMLRIAEALDTTIADLYDLPIRVRVPNVYNRRHTHPADAIYVGRGSDWGNLYRIGEDGTREEVIEKFEKVYVPAILKKIPDWLEPLRGKDLVCWCFPKACHADVLLKLANAEPENVRPFAIRSNQVNQDGFRICLCEGKMREDGTIYLTWTGNKIINLATGKRDRVQLQDEYASMDALLAALAGENVRSIVWQDTKEYQYINRA